MLIAPSAKQYFCAEIYVALLALTSMHKVCNAACEYVLAWLVYIEHHYTAQSWTKLEDLEGLAYSWCSYQTNTMQIQCNEKTCVSNSAMHDAHDLKSN